MLRKNYNRLFAAGRHREAASALAFATDLDKREGDTCRQKMVSHVVKGSWGGGKAPLMVLIENQRKKRQTVLEEWARKMRVLSEAKITRKKQLKAKDTSEVQRLLSRESKLANPKLSIQQIKM